MFLRSGCLILLVALALFLRRWLIRRRDDPECLRLLWTLLVLVGVPTNVLTVRWYSPWGTLSDNMQPYLLLAIVFVASQWPRSSALWSLPLLAFVAEAARETWPLVRLQEVEIPGTFAQGEVVYPAASRFVTYEYMIRNYELKLIYGCEFLADRLGPNRIVVSRVLLLLVLALWLALVLRARRARRAAVS